jgi:hypothetical protein
MDQTIGGILLNNLIFLFFRNLELDLSETIAIVFLNFIFRFVSCKTYKRINAKVIYNISIVIYNIYSAVISYLVKLRHKILKYKSILCNDN